MEFFEFSQQHSGKAPPEGAVQGTLYGDPETTYELQFVLVNSREVFAGPVEVPVPHSGSAPASAPILRCQGEDVPAGLRTANLVPQYKKKGGNTFKNGNSRDINYRCS